MDNKKEEDLWYSVAENLTELSELNDNEIKWKVVPAMEEPDYFKMYSVGGSAET